MYFFYLDLSFTFFGQKLSSGLREGGDSNPFNVFGFNSSIIACICSRKWSHADTQHKFMLNSCIYFNKFIYIDGLLFNGYKNL